MLLKVPERRLTESFSGPHLCADVFGEPLPAFAILSAAQRAETGLLLLVKVVPAAN